MDMFGGAEAGRNADYVADSEGGARVMDEEMVGAIEMLLRHIVSVRGLDCWITWERIK
jgi:hypothetical protein